MKEKLIVIGNGMAGMKVVEELLTANPEQYSITVIGAEPHGNYNRILLSQVLSGEKAINDIMINDKAWYQQNDITLKVGEANKVTDINRKQKYVTTQSGEQFRYDKLLIATGSKPFIVPIEGKDLNGVIAFRDINDVNTMLEYSRNKQHAVILGGGLLGLEAANGLIEQGMHVTVIHNADTILNRQLDQKAATLLQRELENRGVKFRLSAQTKKLVGQQGNITAVEFESGSPLTCDLFIMTVGVRPNIELAQKVGLQCDKGILVNDTLQTYDPAVYAVGECVQHRGHTFGLVAPLFEQAKVCANHLAGHGVGTYFTLAQSTKLKITGVFVFSAGNFMGTPTSEAIIFEDHQAGIYKKLVIEKNVIIGAVLYGDTKDGLWYQSLIDQNVPISLFRTFLIFGRHYCEQIIENTKTNTAKNDLLYNEQVSATA